MPDFDVTDRVIPDPFAPDPLAPNPLAPDPLAPDPLAHAASALDEAVARLERASQAAAPPPDHAALSQVAARLDALIRRLDDEVQLQED